MLGQSPPLVSFARLLVLRQDTIRPNSRKFSVDLNGSRSDHVVPYASAVFRFGCTFDRECCARVVVWRSLEREIAIFA